MKENVKSIILSVFNYGFLIVIAFLVITVIAGISSINEDNQTIKSYKDKKCLDCPICETTPTPTPTVTPSPTPEVDKNKYKLENKEIPKELSANLFNILRYSINDSSIFRGKKELVYSDIPEQVKAYIAITSCDYYTVNCEEAKIVQPGIDECSDEGFERRVFKSSDGKINELLKDIFAVKFEDAKAKYKELWNEELTSSTNYKASGCPYIVSYNENTQFYLLGNSCGNWGQVDSYIYDYKEEEQVAKVYMRLGLNYCMNMGMTICGPTSVGVPDFHGMDKRNVELYSKYEVIYNKIDGHYFFNSIKEID